MQFKCKYTLSETFLFHVIQFSQTVLIQTLQFSISMFNIKTVLFEIIQFSISTQFSSGCDGNEGVLRIPQNSSIIGTSPSDCLVSYLGHSWGEVLPLCRDAVCVFLQPQPIGQSLVIRLSVLFFFHFWSSSF